MYGKCSLCKYGRKIIVNQWCDKYSSKPNTLGGNCEGYCPYYDKLSQTLGGLIEEEIRRRG